MEFNYNQQPGEYEKEKTFKDFKNPLVSIITGYYNAGKYFKQTFNSVMNQTFPWYEWIIVNDGSTNQRDVDLLYRLAITDKRIKVINQKNGGQSSARNTAIRNAATDIIIPLDADDLLSPQYVEYVYWGLYFNQEAAWCYTDSVGFQQEEYLWKYPWSAEKLKTYNFLVSTAGIRKKVLDEAGGYKVEKYSYNEDWRLWLEILQNKNTPVHVGGYLFWYRRLQNGMLSTLRKNPEQQLFSENIIKQAAKKVNGSMKAKEYPLEKSEVPYHEPKYVDLGDEYIVESGRIHILMLIPWMNMGGADKFNLDIVRGLDRKRFEISIITTVPSENTWQQRFEEYTDNIFNLSDFLDIAHYMEFVGYYIKSKSVDTVVVTNSYIGYYMLPWIRKQFPQLSIIDYVHMEEWYWRAGGYARISAMLGGFLDKTYVCNSATREAMVEKLGRSDSSVKTMHIGVDSNYFDRTNVTGGFLYETYNIPSDKDIILFPCRIHPQKRPFMLLDIAQVVLEFNKSVVFVVVGDGEQLEALKAAAVQRKLQEAVIFTGLMDNMRDCYRDAKLTLICSLKEGLALTAYESCAMGVPVVSSDVGGQRDLIDSSVGKLIPVEQDEETEYDSRNFSNHEVMAYAAAIEELLQDNGLYQNCAKNCRAKVENGFSVDKMIERLQDEITKILSDDLLVQEHIAMSQALNKQGKYAEEFYTEHVVYEDTNQQLGEVWRSKCWLENEITRIEEEGQLGEVFRRLKACEEVLNRHEEVVNRHEEVVNRHEEVVNRHEEVVNRHEEVVNRHESSINHQWEVQKWHESRIQILENPQSDSNHWQRIKKGKVRDDD